MGENYGGYVGRILWVNLSKGKFEEQATSDYLPEGIGGRGIAIRIAMKLLKKGIDVFDPESPLIFMTGPLTGTMAPFSGRTTICGLAPQGYPVSWYTRSSFGGHWGPELKYAGFDGIVITGKAEQPVYLKIEDGEYTLESAKELWGKGIIDSQKLLIKRYSKKHRIFAIGPAGENLVRIAVAATETESASGQGGFGALMGSKNLKAIVVRGTGSIKVAEPERFQYICKLIREEAHGSHGWPHTPRLDPELVRKYGQRFQACTQGCAIRCYDARYYTRVPSKLCPGRILSGQVDCIAGLFPGIKGTFYDWELGFEAGFELSQLANNLGLNHWEILVGMFPWLRYLKKDGKLKKVDGYEIDLDDIKFWAFIFNSIAQKKGDICSVLSEGTVRASEKLGIGQERMKELYPAWGYAGHWDGHGDHINKIFFPFWLVSALQWAIDTRDPISSGHGYVQNIMGWCKEHSPVHGLDWDILIDIGKKVYGSRDAFHPESGYKCKAYPAYFHAKRSVLKDSLPVDDQVFPRIFSKKTEDNFARIDGIEGPMFEYEMFKSATGINWSYEELDFYAEKVIQLERLLHIELFNRGRSDDEGLIPYFEKPENLINPFIGYRCSLDRKAFKEILNELYGYFGWDIKSGHPTEKTYRKFNL